MISLFTWTRLELRYANEQIKRELYLIKVSAFQSSPKIPQTQRMSDEDEKQAFLERLLLAIKQSGNPKMQSSTELALQFNLLHPNEPITTQAAHHWLTGNTRPTLEKMETLAQLLDVPVNWLRYGISGDVSRRAPSDAEIGAITPTMEEIRLIAAMRSLPFPHRQLVNDLVSRFCHDFKIWKT